ncbi:MAG TPA: glycosyl hydrolase family 28 protein [Puia sp.]|jgi:hypothetical protein
MKFIFGLFCLLTTTAAFAQTRSFNILSYGARAGDAKDNTRAFQKAIDAAALHGGTVVVPAGRFVTGPIRLRSDVQLYLAEKAVLLGSTKRLDYGSGKAVALISADSQRNISITGKGAIDGQGPELLKDIYRVLENGSLKDAEWKTPNPWGQIRPEEENRPMLIEFRNCDGIVIKGVTMTNGLDWIERYNNCSNVIVDSISVVSNVMWNNDGIDLVDCKKVRLTNSFFNADDDGICLKSESPDGRCEDIFISHCTIRSSASAFKLGTASRGRFSRITVRDLTIYDTYRSAIALETVDGAILEDIDIRGVKATNTGNAVFIRLGRRNRKAPAGELRHVYIGDVSVEVPAGKPDKGYEMEGPPVKFPHNVFPASITGLPGHPVQDVTLENIDITYPGGASRDTAFVSPDSLSRIPEQEADYPEFSMFGELPASGLYVRHVAGLRIKNCRLRYKTSDFRPAFIFDDATGILLSGIEAFAAAAAAN